MTRSDRRNLAILKKTLLKISLNHPFKAWNPHFRFLVEHSLAPDPTIRVALELSFQKMPDSGTGKPRLLRFQSQYVSLDRFTDEFEVLKAVRLLTVDILQHEVDEALRFNGSMPFYPHHPIEGPREEKHS